MPIFGFSSFLFVNEEAGLKLTYNKHNKKNYEKYKYNRKNYWI